jgi:hypothetical protein
LEWEEEDPAVTMLFSYPSLGCEVLKIGKSVSRVNEPPDERQSIEGTPIGEQTIQRKRHLISILRIPAKLAIDSGDVGHHPERSDAGWF